MDPDDTAGVADRLLALWRDPPADDTQAHEAFAAVYTDPLTVNGAPMTVADLLARARALHRAYADIQLELLDRIVAPHRVVIAFLLRARHVGSLATPLGTVRATGRLVTVRTIDVLTVSDGGLISAITVVADELDALRQLDAVALTGG